MEREKEHVSIARIKLVMTCLVAAGKQQMVDWVDRRLMATLSIDLTASSDLLVQECDC